MSHLSRDPFPGTVEIWSVPTPRPGLGGRLAATLALWRERARARRELATLDLRMLRDLGLSPSQVEFEANQPFWRRPGCLR